MNKILWMNHQLNQIIWGWAGVLALTVTALWLLFRLRHLLVFHPFRLAADLLDSMKGRQGKQRRRLLYTALAGTLGTGSIAGAASALALGGPGSLFWIMISGVLGMGLKYAETTLACAYQHPDGKGGWIGGAMILLGEKKKQVFLSVCFCLCCLFAALGVGCMAPAGAIISAARGFSLSPSFTAGTVALLLWLSLSGKGKRIQAINSFLVPLACICYVSACLVILSVYHERLAGVISAVFSSALDPAAFIGGTGGFVVSRAMHYGFTRGIFSHEAGMGSSPLAYASKQCDEPVLLGFIGIIEVFFDTFVITTISALVLLCFFSDGVFFTSDGTMLMQECFTSCFGAPGSFLFAWMIFLFAFPTMLGWYYYASRCLDYLFEGTAVKGAYRLLFVGVLYFSSMLKTDAVWEISDTLNGCMLLCNLYVLWLFQKECVRISKEYLQRRAKQR